MLSTFIFSLAFQTLSALATTKGLSQIVTPDLQKPGEFSLSFQAQNSVIGNPYQVQSELGLTPWFEVAAFRGFDPGESIFGAELGLVQKEPWLLSAGVVNWSTRGGGAQPFLESGFYTEHHKGIAGAIVVNQRTRLLLGWAYDFNPHWRAQLDFESGDENFSTAGFTYTLNDSFQVNPALYVANASGHALSGYFVVTYTFNAWQAPTKPGKPESL